MKRLQRLKKQLIVVNLVTAAVMVITWILTGDLTPLVTVPFNAYICFLMWRDRRRAETLALVEPRVSPRPLYPTFTLHLRGYDDELVGEIKITHYPGIFEKDGYQARVDEFGFCKLYHEDRLIMETRLFIND